MPHDPLDPNRCARLLSALAAPERLVIVRLLRDAGPMNVGDIATASAVAPLNISHHLIVLKRAGIVKRERRGRYVQYRLSPKVFAPAEMEGMLNLGCCQLQLP